MLLESEPRRSGGSHAVDPRAAAHLLNRLAFGPRPDSIERVQATGLRAYIEVQLHPERIADADLDRRLADLKALEISPRAFAADYYQPMNVARQEFTDTQKLRAGGPPLRYLRWHLQPIAAMTLPGDKPINAIQQATVTQEEIRFQRENQDVFDQLQAQKLLRAVYSERQLQEVLVDFWFNHFNVDARKIEDRPVVVEYEREVIRPRVLGRFRDLLGATAHSPAMLFYLDNWMSAGTGRGVNENYGRELLELHTLGVDGGYTQRDVAEVARAFTGWTLRNPHDGSGFFFDIKKHDHAAKHVLGHTLKAGRGVEDGDQVLDILARHPSTAHFIASKLVQHFVADDPPPALVDRAARTFRKTDGDLREVMRTILTSREFLDSVRLSRQGEIAVRIRGQRTARDQRHHHQPAQLRGHDFEHRRAALPVSAADRLRRPIARLDQYRHPGQPAQFRAVAHGQRRQRLESRCASHRRGSESVRASDPRRRSVHPHGGGAGRQNAVDDEDGDRPRLAGIPASVGRPCLV